MASKNQNTQVYQRGWLDTRDRIQLGLAADPYVSALFSRHAEMLHLRNQSTDVVSAAITICCGARYLVDQKPLPQSQYIIALTIGELMSPMLPYEMCLDEEQATKVFERILDMLISEQNIYTRKYSTTMWLDQLEAAFEHDSEEDDGESDAAPQFNAEVVARLRAQVTGRAFEDISVEHKVDYLVWLATHLQPTQYLTTVALIVTSYVGVAKHGTISERFIDKIQSGIEADLGVEVVLSPEVIQHAYNMYGRYVTAQNAKEVFDRWLKDIPEHALRLRLTLSQVTGSGLTAFIIIGRAITKYPNFGWAKLNLLTGGELANYAAAVKAVGGNPYYGFNRDLGAARSTLFSSVAYVAKELLYRLNGETSLKNYKGWIKKPKSATTIESMITTYVDTETASMRDGDTREGDQLLFDNIKTDISHGENVNLFA